MSNTGKLKSIILIINSQAKTQWNRNANQDGEKQGILSFNQKELIEYLDQKGNDTEGQIFKAQSEAEAVGLNFHLHKMTSNKSFKKGKRIN